MNVSKELISLLSTQEKRGFIRHLSARNKRHDTRNQDLFRAFTKGNETRIQREIGNNAYNVLNKRLGDRLLDYIAVTILESQETQQLSTLKQLLVARKLLGRNRFKLAFRLLNKAEKEALKLQDYTLLNDIYSTLIEHSYHELAPNQEVLFKNFNRYQEEFQNQQRLNMVYAYLRKAFNTLDKHLTDFDFKHEMQETFQRFGVSKELGYNFKTLHQIALIADISGAYRRDYSSIDLFFEEQVHALQNGPLDTEKYILYHIDTLYLLANIYFRKKQFSKSLALLDEMLKQMQKYDGKYFEAREVQYRSMLALNLNFVGEYSKAEKELKQLLCSDRFDEMTLMNPRLIRIMIHFQQGELNEAYALMSKFQHSDNWYERNVSVEWNQQKRYIEILLHIELGNYDYADSCITSFIRKYGQQFKQNKDLNVLTFLKLVKSYYNQPHTVSTTEFRTRVEEEIHWRDTEQEDIFLMCFYAWLKAKMEKQDIYDVTLKLVHA